MSKPLYTIEDDTLTFDCTEELPSLEELEAADTEKDSNVVELFRD